MEVPTPRVSQYNKVTTLPASLSRRESNVHESLTTDDFTRAVAVATVSALRQQQAHSHSPGRMRSATAEPESTGAGGHGGHDAPSWSRTTSASVLLACTALYAVIAGMCFDRVMSICSSLFFFLFSRATCGRC
jgi:Ca2+/H+ antiporter